jgi:hypothetical protein
MSIILKKHLQTALENIELDFLKKCIINSGYIKPELTVIGTVFKGKGKEGDFEWQIKSGLYEDALFLFNDDEKRRHWKKAGAGNAVIRKYNKNALIKPRSHGIVTGNDTGYTSLTPQAKYQIDKCITEAKQIIKEQGYTKVYYSAATFNGLIGTSIFQIGDDVRKYITQQIKNIFEV